MLQEHATCLQQHLLNKTNNNFALNLSSNISSKEQLKCLQEKSNKHEISALGLSTLSQQGITVKPRLTEAKTLKQPNNNNNNNNNSNNVALHSVKENNKPKFERETKIKASETLALWAAQMKATLKGPKNAQEIKPGLAKGITTKPSLILYQQQQQHLKAQNLKQIITATTTTSLLIDKPQKQQQNIIMPQTTKQQHQKQHYYLLNPQQELETLDFNSRRRRGRLRWDSQSQLQQLGKEEDVVPNPNSEQKTREVYCKQQKHEKAFNNVPATKYLNNVAKLNLITIVATILLTQMFYLKQQIQQFVNKNRKIKTQTQQQQKLKLKPTTTTENLVLSLIKNINQHSNNKTKRKNSHTTTTTSLTTYSSSSLTSSPNTRTFLLYAFLFLTTLLILPLHQPAYSIAEAAKPKSATQQQQQHSNNNNNHLQQQQHQHHHQQQQQQPQQDKPNIAYAAGADNIHIDKEGTILTPPSYQVVSSQTSNEELGEETEYILDSDERNFDLENESINEVNEEERDSYEKFDNETHYDNTTVIKTPLFPKDLFTKEQLENGAVICHIIGVIYMFVALAIVCDEFFVPSLDVIIEKLGITDDVAGATFMAAGGSAPELFTSVIGVFVSFDDVGIGTIVGSAVFNILFVIGMCALFSKTVLTLTWWPLFRDCTFYSISLMVLIFFFRDNLIYWWEALILFSIYCAYVTFMKWNVQVETCVKKVITKNKGNAANSSETSMATQPGGSVTSRAASESRSGPPGSSSGAGTTGNSSGGNASSTQTGAKFRHGLLQLMIHTIDPLHDDDVPGKVDEKATQLHAIASLKVLLDATKPQRGGATTSAANHVKINLKETTLADRPNGNIDTTLDSPSLSGRRASWIDQRVKIQTRKFSIKQTQEIEDEPEPLSMAWPDTARKRLTYILVAPLLIPMWLTLPDTRTPKGKKLFPVTFIGSILWIAAFSYLMVWWANVAGDTARIPPEVMGLTFLAAGTSIPDLITSVIVARKGFGDMAVSSSVGSNIFDVTVGLPIPWLLYGIFYGAPVEVNSVGMVCSITILFMMLIFVVMSIACFRWRMNKGLGFTMFLLYFVFVAVSLMFEYDVITCPV
ncbi:solute carrier family 24 member Nckx30C isoform 3-T5 [Cochliomyia hominivorax]